MKTKQKPKPKNRKKQDSTIYQYLVIQYVAVITILAISIIAVVWVISSALPSYTTTHALLTSTNIYISPAQNMTECTPYGCVNATREGNYTLTYNISSYGYLVFNSTDISNEGIGIVMWEQYAKGIPQNKQYLFQLYGQQQFYASYSETYFNATTSPAVIPIVPGSATIKLYNPQPYGIDFNLSIEEVAH
jgi:hypothetical protein